MSGLKKTCPPFPILRGGRARRRSRLSLGDGFNCEGDDADNERHHEAEHHSPEDVPADEVQKSEEEEYDGSSPAEPQNDAGQNEDGSGDNLNHIKHLVLLEVEEEVSHFLIYQLWHTVLRDAS